MTEKSTFSEREHTSLMLASFRFSRGVQSVQRSMFKFWAAEYGGRFDPDILDSIAPRLGHIAGNFMFKSGIHPRYKIGEAAKNAGQSISERIDEEIDKQITEFERTLANPNLHPVDMQPLTSYFGDLTEADMRRIPFWGASDKKSFERSMPLRYKSNVLSFGFLQRSTEQPLVDEFFRRTTEAYLRGSPDDSKIYNAGIRLGLVTGAHLAYNPEDAEPLSKTVARGLFL